MFTIQASIKSSVASARTSDCAPQLESASRCLLPTSNSGLATIRLPFGFFAVLNLFSPVCRCCAVRATTSCCVSRKSRHEHRPLKRNPAVLLHLAVCCFPLARPEQPRRTHFHRPEAKLF